jgi:hypothetical protein
MGMYNSTTAQQQEEDVYRCGYAHAWWRGGCINVGRQLLQIAHGGRDQRCRAQVRHSGVVEV